MLNTLQACSFLECLSFILLICKTVRGVFLGRLGEVFFSDETMIRQFYQRVIVRRPPGIRYLQRYVLKTVKHPISIMIWGCISRNGRSQLKIYKTGVHVNGEICERLLRERLQNEMLQHHG